MCGVVVGASIVSLFICCGCCLDEEKAPLITNMEEEPEEVEEEVPVIKDLEEEPEEIEEEESCEVPQVVCACVHTYICVHVLCVETEDSPHLRTSCSAPCSRRR